MTVSESMNVYEELKVPMIERADCCSDQHVVFESQLVNITRTLSVSLPPDRHSTATSAKRHTATFYVIMALLVTRSLAFPRQ